MDSTNSRSEDRRSFFSWKTSDAKYLLLGFILALLGSYRVAHSQTTANSEGERLFREADSLFYIHPPSKKIDEEAVNKYREAIRYLPDTNIGNLKIAEAHQKIGNIMEMNGQYADALVEYKSAFNRKQQLVNLPDTFFLTDYLYIGNTHLHLENYDSSDFFYSKALSIANNYDYVKESESVFNSIGFLHYSLGNYEKALNFFNKTLSVLNDHSVYADSPVRLISNIAIVKTKLGRYDEAIKDYKSIIDRDFRETFRQQLGRAYLEIGKYDSAKLFLKESLRSKKLPTQISAHNNLAEAYYKTGAYDSAKYYFIKSIAVNKKFFTPRNTYLAKAYIGLAQIQQAQNNLDSTLHYYQLALINTTFDYNDSTVTSNPKESTQAISLLHLFDVLQGKAAAWNQYYRQDQDTTKLTYALETYQRAIRVAQHIQKTYDNDEAKLFLVNKVAPIYGQAIATAVHLYELTQDPRYVTQAFQFSENSKASVLTESLRDVKIKASGEVNDSLLREEQRVKQQITALRLKLVESQDSARNETYRQQLNDLEISLAHTIKYLQKDEHYYQRKYQPDTLDVAALQRALVSSDEALLEYFVGKDQLYLFLITPDNLQVTSVVRTAELDSALQRTQRQLYSFKPGQGADEASLATLYRYLITPVAEVVNEVSKLTIIADGPFHYLPFDLLSVDGRPANYLLQTHTLHYGYSALLLQQAADERRGFPTATVLAMAPFAGEETGNVRSGGFGLLHYSQAEVESVGGSVYLEGKATKRQFLKVAGANNVLHLATHATVDSEDPSQSFIAFYPNQRDSVANYRLYTHELYNMRLDSVKLVVLSACEAGKGQLVQGEGVMSLARAFAYAGCPNIVTTLWKADDWAAARLTSSMHHYLKEGWEKDEALRQAKLDYLADERVQPTHKAPYYWANFVFIGDPVPIYDDYRLWWWIGIGLLLLTIVGLLVMRRRWQAKEMA